MLSTFKKISLLLLVLSSILGALFVGCCIYKFYNWTLFGVYFLRRPSKCSLSGLVRLMTWDQRLSVRPHQFPEIPADGGDANDDVKLSKSYSEEAGEPHSFYIP